MKDIKLCEFTCSIAHDPINTYNYFNTQIPSNKEVQKQLIGHKICILSLIMSIYSIKSHLYAQNEQGHDDE
jgi:hypothetical protein